MLAQSGWKQVASVGRDELKRNARQGLGGARRCRPRQLDRVVAIAILLPRAIAKPSPTGQPSRLDLSHFVADQAPRDAWPGRRTGRRRIRSRGSGPAVPSASRGGTLPLKSGGLIHDDPQRRFDPREGARDRRVEGGRTTRLWPVAANGPVAGRATGGHETAVALHDLQMARPDAQHGDVGGLPAVEVYPRGAATRRARRGPAAPPASNSPRRANPRRCRLRS